MKFLHIADLHLGKMLNQINLREDQKFILNQIIDIAVNNNVDGLFISGDLYDRAVPSAEAVILLNDFLNRLINEKHIKGYIISGNHDSKDRLNFLSSLLKNNGLFIQTYLQIPLYCIQLKKVNIYMMPYFSPSELRIKEGLDSDTIRTRNDAVKYVLDRTPLDKNKKNILLAHELVVNANNEAVFSDSEQIVSVGTLDAVSASLFSDFDYVALGHLHTPQVIGDSNVYYGGSPLKYSASEVGRDKSVQLIEINENNEVLVSSIPLKPMYDVKTITGYFYDLMQNPQILDYTYVYFNLLDKNVIEQGMAKLKRKYPNALSLTYNNDFEKNLINDRKISKSFHQKTPIEQFCEFYKIVSNTPLTEDENKVLTEEIKKVVNKNVTN